MKINLRYWWLWACTAAMALSACATTPKVTVVKEPVPVTCATPQPVEPVYPVVNTSDGLYVRTQKLLIKEQLHEGYIKQLQAWGGACQG